MGMYTNKHHTKTRVAMAEPEPQGCQCTVPAGRGSRSARELGESFAEEWHQTWPEP